jgi:hypothetical protein
MADQRKRSGHGTSGFRYGTDNRFEAPDGRVGGLSAARQIHGVECRVFGKAGDDGKESAMVAGPAVDP